MSDRPLSYSRPKDILELMLEGFITIEEGRAKYIAAGGKLADFENYVVRHRKHLISDKEAGFE